MLERAAYKYTGCSGLRRVNHANCQVPSTYKWGWTDRCYGLMNREKYIIFYHPPPLPFRTGTSFFQGLNFFHNETITLDCTYCKGMDPFQLCLVSRLCFLVSHTAHRHINYPGGPFFGGYNCNAFCTSLSSSFFSRSALPSSAASIRSRSLDAVSQDCNSFSNPKH